jgi:hypothetical protein
MRWISSCRKESTITIGASNDSFKPSDESVLLAASRALEANNYNFSTVRSIPDIFYYARLYEIMLYADNIDNSDPFFSSFKTQIECEWRAMLALLVLSKTLDLPITAVPFPKKGNSSFVLERIALNRLPNSNLWNIDDYGWSWENSVMFMLDGSPIAMSSPITIIVPSADAWKVLKKYSSNNVDDMPEWTRNWVHSEGFDVVNDTIIDPVELMNQDNAHYLWTWLIEYTTYVQKNGSDHSLCNNVNIARRIYADDIQISANNGILARFKNALEEKHKFKLSELPKDKFEIRYLADLLPELTRDPMQSDILMDGNNLSLFVDCNKVRSDIEIGNKKPKEIKALGAISLKALAEDKDKKLEIINKKGVTVYFSDDILSDKIWIVHDGVKNVENGKNNIIPNKEVCASVIVENCGVINKVTIDETTGCCWIPMPLTPLGFKLIDEYKNTKKPVKYNVDYESGSTDSIKFVVKLSIPMSDKSLGIDHGYYILERIYTGIHSGKNPNGKIMNSQLNNTLEAGIWPNCKIPGWNTYFLYCNRFSEDSSSITHIEPFEEDIAVDKNGIRIERLHPFEYGISINYYQLNKFPEFVAAYNGANTLVGFVPFELNEAKISLESHTKYETYIDFGTSATVIFRKYTDYAAEKLVDSREELASGIIFHKSEINSVPGMYFNQFFFPYKQIEVPFPSLLHDFKSVENENETRREHVLDARLFFKQLVNGYNNPDSKYGRVLSNLKWSRTKVDKYRLDVYFQHLARLTCLDAHLKNCDTISVTASYPGAMENPLSNMMAIKEAYRIVTTNDTQKVRFLDNDFNIITEGKAAAQKFQNTIPARCVIDIGGGSSDLFFIVKLISNGKTQFVAKDSSIRFGARDVLVKILHNDAKRYCKDYKKTYLYRLALDSNVYLDEFPNRFEENMISKIISASGTKEHFEADLEELFARPLYNDENETIGDRLHRAFSVIDKKFQEKDRQFLTLLAINLAATVYYAGMLARNLADLFDKIELSFAGNGSKMLKWIGDEKQVEKFLKIIFLHARSREKSMSKTQQKDDMIETAQNRYNRLNEEAKRDKRLKGALEIKEEELDRKISILKKDFERLISRIEIAFSISVNENDLLDTLNLIENTRCPDENSLKDINCIRKVYIDLEDIKNQIQNNQNKLSIAQRLAEQSESDLKDAEIRLNEEKNSSYKQSLRNLEDSISGVKVILAKNGKLVAAEGMSKKAIDGLKFNSYEKLDESNKYADIYNDKNNHLLVGGRDFDTNKSNTAIIAGEGYRNKFGYFSADSIIDLDSLKEYEDNGVYVSSGINVDNILSDEFVEFCHAFNNGVMQAYGCKHNRSIYALDIFPIPGKNVNPAIKIPSNTWNILRRDNLEDYLSEVISFENSRLKPNSLINKYENDFDRLQIQNDNSQEEVANKSFFFIEIQTLVDYLLDYFSNGSNGE